MSDLRQRVSHAMWHQGVDAAIAIVLEEAARVVVENYQELCAEHRLLLLNRANAIRALKSGNDS